MRPSQALALYGKEICAIAASHHVTNVRVFGSCLHERDTEESDLDLLVDPTSQTTLFELAKLQNNLQKILHIPVDIVTPGGLPFRFREQILKEARPV